MEISTVLLVDDEVLVSNALRSLLAHIYPGIEIFLAFNGKQALEIVENFGPSDLTITDVDMPEMGGIELTERLKGKYPDLPIILISGGLEPPKKHLANIFLPKPIIAEELKQALNQLSDPQNKS